MTDEFAVAVLPFTDTVLRIDFSGAILRTQRPPTFERQITISSPDYTASSVTQGQSVQDKKNKVPPKGPSDDDRKALVTNTGDRSIYRFYFQSIGIRWFMIFIATTIAGTFCSHFSREFNPESDDLTITNSSSERGLAPILD